MDTLTLDTAVAEIERRGGETAIIGRNGRPSAHLQIVDERDGLMLLTAHGWRQYSRAFGARWSSLAYLAGVDDNGPWAVRIPATLTTVAEALAWLEPPEVTRARRDGRRVRRQGDVYAVETTRQHDGRGADQLDTHRWNAETRYLIHRPADGRKHRPLRVPYPARFIRQRAYGMGRGAGRGAAD